MRLEEKIKDKCRQLGFELVGITTAEPLGAGHAEHFSRWLEGGCAGTMAYMHRNLDKRLAPDKLLKGAKSVICVGMSYKPAAKPAETDRPSGPCGLVADYAAYDDYHPFIKARLFELAEFISDYVQDENSRQSKVKNSEQRKPALPAIRFKACVDSVPIAERAFAQRAGLGFFGRNHMLINPDLGCQLFLGELITTLELTPDQPLEGDCGSCRRCIDACPTGALTENGMLDASNCINYLTIEHEGPISEELSGRISAKLFGCETCIKVCPFQAKAPAAKPALPFHPERRQVSLAHIAELEADSFEAEFANSTLIRTGLEKIKKNADICVRNLTDSKKTG